MKRLAILAALVLAIPLLAADNANSSDDPFAGSFIPPELIMLAGDQAGLGREKRDAVRAKIDAAKARGDELTKQLSVEMNKLATMIKEPRIDETAVLTQLDQLLNTERELKRLRISTMVSIKNSLTPEQQAKLRELAKGDMSGYAGALKQRLTAKVDRVKQAAEKMAANGKDPSAIAKAMDEKVRPLVDAGNPIEAEAALDQILAGIEKAQNQ